ncbi:hypothetical protein [Pleionea sp. CnH1-48]|uniref:hypothetical protein n=1 Tax=Pleionea sp. CnH1-48 TaxID=2954494 RepID=UPI002097E764|nr:hypothetical protein [Pleionea sp. CnH1-48]MCO7223845.1 hypothetical protein [Pleionea sp. CnH1-48]
MKLSLPFIFLLLTSCAQASDKKISPENNPHGFGTPEWEKHETCLHTADLTKINAESVATLKEFNQEQKRRSILKTMGREPLNENTVNDLLDRNRIKMALEHEKAPQEAFNKMWEYCMGFSVKEHYYKDDRLEDVKALEDIDGM